MHQKGRARRVLHKDMAVWPVIESKLSPSFHMSETGLEKGLLLSLCAITAGIAGQHTMQRYQESSLTGQGVIGESTDADETETYADAGDKTPYLPSITIEVSDAIFVRLE